MSKSKSNGKPVVGVDLGGTKILAAVVNKEGKLLSRAKKSTKADKDPDQVLDRICLVIREAVEEADLTINDIAAIGAGSPGPLDPETGIIIVAPNLGWKNVDLKGKLEGEFKLPTFIDNDVNVGTLGEHRLGAGKGVANLIGIFVGTGIGGGIIIDNKLYTGFNKTAGEVGHIILQPKDGPKCGCGNIGCMEALASRTAIDRMIREQLDNGKKSVITSLLKDKNARIKSGVLRDAMEHDDKVVSKALKKATYYLGVGVAGLINLLSPEMIILGGGVVEAMPDFFTSEVEKVAVKHSFPNASKNVRFVPARLGDDAGVLGAAVMAQMKM
jgi:glucokinase